jgi:ABC-2 type transport system ATP-binding protein
MISIRNISKAYGQTVALDRISIEIAAGDFYGLLGPNGAGKSTLLNILVGYLRPESGEVTMAGIDILRDPMAVRRKIGFVPQEIALYDQLTGIENLRLFGALHGLSSRVCSERARELLESAGLFERRNDRVSTYSGGMKRRLNIIASLLHSPEALLCDEPTVGVDPQSRNAIFDFLRQMHGRGVTIVYTTHYMEEAERLCNRIGIVDRGILIANGSLEELMKLAPGKRGMSIALADDSDFDLDRVKEFGHVSRSGATLSIIPHASEVPMSRLLQRLEESGVSFQDIRFERPTLESLFLHLTGRSLRE